MILRLRIWHCDDILEPLISSPNPCEKDCLEPERLKPQGSLPHSEPPHITNLPLTPSREVGWPPRQESLVCCFWDWKGQVPALPAGEDEAEEATDGGETRLGLVCCTGAKEWWEEVGEGRAAAAAAGGWGGDDGRPSPCHPVVKQDKWSRGRNLGSVHSQSTRTGALKCQLSFPCGWTDAYIRRFVKTQRGKSEEAQGGGPGSRAGRCECSCAAKERNWSMSSLFAVFRNV